MSWNNKEEIETICTVQQWGEKNSEKNGINHIEPENEE